MASRLGLTLLLLMLFGCASSPEKSNLSLTPKMEESQYFQVIEKFTSHAKEYEGFHQAFEAHATILNSTVQLASLNRKAEFLGWEREKLHQEREKAFQEMSAYSKFFISFFSPERDYNDLNKPNSIWRVYLEFNGQRFEGKVEKHKAKQVELKRLYPYVDRFRTPYEVTFNVPMNSLEQMESKLILTSSLGTATLVFPPASPN